MNAPIDINRDMTPDELYDIIASEIDSIYDACHAQNMHQP